MDLYMCIDVSRIGGGGGCQFLSVVKYYCVYMCTYYYYMHVYVV